MAVAVGAGRAIFAKILPLCGWVVQQAREKTSKNRWIAGCDASSCRTDKTDGRVSERVPMRRGGVQNKMKGTAQKMKGIAQKNVMGTALKDERRQHTTSKPQHGRSDYMIRMIL
jgi:hypothetical protein